MRTFKDNKLDSLYRYLLFNPPTVYVQHKGRSYRKTGAGMFFPFWIGYDNPTGNTPFVHGSTAYASWASGVDYRKLGGKDYPKQ